MAIEVDNREDSGGAACSNGVEGGKFGEEGEG